jgi:hypothetical protein
MATQFESILNTLGNRDLILPYFEAGVLSERWPDHYDIRVDSRPYYGLGDGYFHPSTHPLMGERELYYRFHPATKDLLVPERRSLTDEMSLCMGSAGHAVLQTHMTMAGLVKDADDIEREYINEEHHVRGRIDWLVDHPNGMRLVTEFKTRMSYRYTRQDEPEPSWLAQLNLALDAMDEDLGVLLMMESAWPWRFVEFHVKRDQALLDSIYAKFDRVRAAIANNEPPRHCCSPDSPEMEKCAARFECWLK